MASRTETDEEAALEAIATLQNCSGEQKKAQEEIDTLLLDENPFANINELFPLYDTLYFRGLLLRDRVEVSWSSRLTLCAGICELLKDNAGKYRRIRVKLSEPLLKYRTREDTVNTFLHELMHAYFFVTTSFKHSREDGGHGPGFLLLANSINNHGSYFITVFHTFHDEVDSYRTHVWQCNGSCKDRPPFFGLVKRSMNRPPSKSDFWWTRHEAECGGEYTKIAEPKPTKAQIASLSAKERAGRQKNKINAWLTPAADAGPVDAGTEASRRPVRKRAADEQTELTPKRATVECPICNARVAETSINDHLDNEHSS
ncbi:hypothetical protein P152DRAFT_426047 [Eremomyces bilateralis CBS 781.70]|uniref:Protein with SprT-like domain at the N terminus n=1 Tax=Eremomyces bilateralis CBS 781.70 TaxID=1392243 RepID=A0A6G1GFS7_9PEZI|nr:uncharacterized protein P152DRAFT_426047 [Eremomyces bilateralis CBS 781.70]KAF1816776.1 hypothetical protein P152DRAFT_426047 [Eremomyces bilateralis CBS 781.70]